MCDSRDYLSVSERCRLDWVGGMCEWTNWQQRVEGTNMVLTAWDSDSLRRVGILLRTSIELWWKALERATGAETAPLQLSRVGLDGCVNNFSTGWSTSNSDRPGVVRGVMGADWPLLSHGLNRNTRRLVHLKCFPFLVKFSQSCRILFRFRKSRFISVLASFFTIFQEHRFSAPYLLYSIIVSFSCSTANFPSLLLFSTLARRWHVF